MRRPKRQVTEKEEIKRIIDECKVCRLGLNDSGRIYIVPMNFGYEFREEKLVLYFHSAKVGRKIEILKQNPKAGIELDCRHGLMEAEKPCSHSYYFASLIGSGTAYIEEDTGEKRRALNIIMKHQTGKTFDNFEEKWVNAVAVVRVELDEYTCKHHDGTN